MARPSKLGAYAKLSSTYYQDDALLTVSPEAELLFVRGLAFCAGQMSDGFISDAQLKLVGVGLRSCTRRAEELHESGLWVRVDGGYVARGWHKWNKSAEEIGAERRKDRERKARAGAENSNEFQVESERNPSGYAPDSLSEIGQDRTGQDRTAAHAEPAAAAAGLFEDFWSTYPRREKKQAARTAFAKAVKAGTPATDIIDGARRYRDDPNRDQAFTAHPTSWLNAGRWDDDPLPPRPGNNSRPHTPPTHSPWDTAARPPRHEESA